MSDNTYLKAFCKKCYGKIEFPDHARGATINCPHCGQSTVLSVAQAAPVAAAAQQPQPPPPPTGTPDTQPPGPPKEKVPWWAKAPAAKPADAPPTGAKAATAKDAIAEAEARAKARAKPAATTPEAPAKPRATAVKVPSKISAALATPLDEIYEELGQQKDKQFCPSCSSRIDLGLSICPNCGAGLARHVRIIRRWGLLLLIALIIAFPFLLPRDSKLPIAALEKQKAKIVKPTRPDIEMINPSWTKSKEGNVYAVTGMVVNNSAHRYLALRVEFELIDKAGNPLGKTIDQLGILEPKKNWNFKAIAIDPDATGFKFIGLSAQKAPKQ